MHKSAYGDDANRALALLPVDIEAPSARGKRKCIRIRIRIFADFGRKCPPMKLIRLCPSSSPADAQGVSCSCTPFFGPSDGLSSFRGEDVAIRFAPRRKGRQGFDFQAMTSTEIKKRPGNVIVFRLGFIQPTATPQGGPQAIHRPQAIGDPLSGPSRIRTGSGFQ